MKVEITFRDTDARSNLYFLRERYGKPRASLATLCKIAVLREVAAEAEAELKADEYVDGCDDCAALPE